MEFEPKIIPEGINTGREHPLREFFVLVGGISLVVVLAVGILAASADYLVGFIPVEKEIEWFAAEAEQLPLTVQDEAGPALEAEVEAYLQQIVERLRSPDLSAHRFEITLLAESTPNAFVLPGGRIYVTSELLRVVESENGLAMVLAHEMAHQYHRHPLRSLGRGIVVSLALLVISGADGGGMAEGLIGNTALLTQLGFSREQEREADATGLELLLAAYGHSSGAAEFFEAVQRLPESATELPEFLSTHPGTAERVEILRDHARRHAGDTIPLPALIGRYLAALEA